MTTFTRRFLSVSLFLAAAPLAAAQGLLVVDAAGGPGSQYTSIADAVAAAPDGATVLVHAGTYAPFVIDGKTLIVVAAVGESVVVTDGEAPGVPVTVRHVAPSQVVVLEGLTARAVNLIAVQIEDCGGQVWLQDCQAGFDLFVFGQASLRVEDSNQVILVRSVMGFIAPFPSSVAAGLLASQSRVFAYESDLRGGNPFGEIGHAGPGARVDGGMLFAEGSTIIGGTGYGEDGFPIFGCINYPSGDGLQLNGTATAIALDTSVLAGPKGGPTPGCATTGQNTVIATSATYQSLPGPSASFSVDSPSPDGEPTTLHFQAQHGDVPLLLVATSIGPTTYFPKYKGAIAMGSPFMIVLSPLPATGTLDLPVNFGDVIPSGSASTMFLQAAYLKNTGGGMLADPAALTTTDE